MKIILKKLYKVIRREKRREVKTLSSLKSEFDRCYFDVFSLIYDIERISTWN